MTQKRPSIIIFREKTEWLKLTASLYSLKAVLDMFVFVYLSSVENIV